MAENFSNVVGKATSGITRALYSALLCVVKTSGKSAGYAGRVAGEVCKATKQLVGYGSKKSAGLFTGGVRKKYGLTKAEVQAKLAVIENRIRDLYLEIGRMGTGSDDIDGVLATAEAEEIIDKIKKLEEESGALNKYLAELEEAERKGVPLTRLPVKPRGDIEGQLFRRLASAVDGAVRKATFSLRSDAIIFEKSLRDLLEAEMDIKRLAVSELGKLGNRNAGPVLKEALAIGNDELQAEIINTLIQLNDGDIFAVCKRNLKHPYSGVRTACIRGLYKSGQAEAALLLIDALKDESIEVRNSSAMFLGWIESKQAVPALLQAAAADGDSRVRKSALQALENIRDEGAVLPLIRLLNDKSAEIRDKVLVSLQRITGESLEVGGSDNENERLADVNRLKEWWIKKKHDMANGSGAPDQGVVETEITGAQEAAAHA